MNYTKSFRFALVSISACLPFFSNAEKLNILSLYNPMLHNDKEPYSLNTDNAHAIETYISINDKEYLLSLSSEYSGDADAPMINSFEINSGDTYSVRIKAMDGRWYHTNAIKYESQSNEYNITIKGRALPEGVYVNGDKKARFYNDDGWPHSVISCQFIVTGVGPISCSLSDGPNLVDQYNGVVTGIGSVGSYVGDGYFDPGYVKDNYKIDFSGIQYTLYTNITWSVADGIKTVGYANFFGIGNIGLFDGDGIFSAKTACPTGTTTPVLGTLCDVGPAASQSDFAFVYNQKLFISTNKNNNCPSNTIDDGVYNGNRHCYYNKVDLSKYKNNTPQPWVVPLVANVSINPYVK